MITQGWWDGAIENYSLIIMDLPFKLKKKKKKKLLAMDGGDGCTVM